ncbi:MAG: preprotein translocase subunit SecE [Patescibacteria group bacterium]|jgi:preprotein translocase subunit SecE
MNKILNYFKGAKEELSKVVWPSKEITIKHTVVVIVVSVFIAAFLGIIDLGLSFLVERVIK